MQIDAEDIPVLSPLLDELMEMNVSAQWQRLSEIGAGDARVAQLLRDMLAVSGGNAPDASAFVLPQMREQPDASAGEKIGPYELIEVIGTGGMGSVWRARRADGLFDREVALKLPRLSRSPQLAERMADERRIGALLEHPRIARLYDAGIDDQGRPYLVMERVRGQSFTAYCATHCTDVRSRVEMMIQACEAVAHAHGVSVIHRDIKPSNLMVTDDGQLKLLDFGIARLVEPSAVDEPGDLATAARTRTPEYAAPEQEFGGRISTRTDIYSLGVVLHELLTGKRPATSDGKRVVVDAGLDADLRAVLTQCLQTDPALRYTFVERLSDDLKRFLAFRPVEARAAKWPHRSALFFRRHRWSSVAATGVAILLGAAGLALHRQHALEEVQALRSAKTRVFLFDMLESAERESGQDAEDVTALQMVHGALTRARQGFVGQPMLRGQILSELGLMLRRMGRIDEALQAMGEADGLLRASADADDPELHIERGQQALALQERGSSTDLTRMRELADSVLAGCSARVEDCAKAHAYAHDALLSDSIRRNDPVAAMQHATLAVENNIRGFGATHLETALALSNRAVLLRNQGRLSEGWTDIDQAMKIARDVPIRLSDSQNLRLRHALLLSDLGRYDPACEELTALLRSPVSASVRATAQRILAQSRLAQGLLESALQEADFALATARSASDDWEYGFALQTRAGALSGLLRHAEAMRDIGETLLVLRREGLSPEGVEVLRARRVQALIAMRAGDEAFARTQLEALVSLQRRGSAGPKLADVDFAQLLDLLGEAARKQGDLAASGARHSEASGLLSATLPDAHPLRTRNALLSAVTGWLAAVPADEGTRRTQVSAAVASYLQSLPPASAWRSSMPADNAPRDAWAALLL